MSLPAIIITSIIFSIMSMAAFNQSSYYVDLKSYEEEKANMMKIRDAILDNYESSGQVETDLNALGADYFYDLSSLKDKKGMGYVVLNNSGAPFSFNGSGKIYRAVVIAPHDLSVDSTIESDDFKPRKSENYFLLTQSEINQTLREKTKDRILTCDSASQNYNSVEGSYPANVIDLISKSYLLGMDSMDYYGKDLLIDSNGKCYSMGVNHVDNAKLVDDIA